MLVRVESTQGSVPREAGTWMAVFAEGLVGTIGGGHLELKAIARARALLQVPGQKIEKSPVKFVLGPTLRQCRGGVVYLGFKRVTFQDAPALKQFFNNEHIAKLTPVALFGGGHVHNTYFTLPVLFAMLSNHYSFTWSHPQNWLVLILMMLAGAAICQFFVLRHGYKLRRNCHPLGYALVAVAVAIGVIIWLKPDAIKSIATHASPASDSSKNGYKTVVKVFE